ncbi:MAG: FliH/SctL family protein [Burkholderiaceae bacterium]
MTTGGKKNLTLVKPNNPLFVPPERTGLFHEDLTDTPPVGAFQSGLPEKAIELPGPLVQQAIARAIAGLNESPAFQAMDTAKMAKVNRLAHGVPMDVVSESQVDTQGLLKQEEKDSAKPKSRYEETPEPKAEGLDAKGDAAKDLGEAAVTGTEQEGEVLHASHEPKSDEAKVRSPQDEPAEITEPGADKAGGADQAAEEVTDAAEAAKAEREPSSADEGLPAAQADAESASSSNEEGGAQRLPEMSAGDADRDSDGPEVEGVADGDVAADATDIDADEAETEAANEAPPVKDPRQEEIENYPVPEGMQLVSREDLEALHAEAYESGRQAGIEEGASQLDEAVNAAKEAAHQEGYDKAYEEAYAKGEAAARDELQAEVELASQDLKDLTQKLEEAAKDTDQFYAPLLKLAMHLAEQLVRGELTASGKAIAHLVETSLLEFENDPNSPILVKLNPEDLERIKAYETLLPKNAILKADPTMFVGSVRVQINGALIEDLIEQRSTALWQALTRGQDAGEPPPSFLKNLELMKEAFDEVEAETAHEPSLGNGEANVEQALAPETIQADASVPEDSAPEDLSGDEVPSEEPIAEGSEEDASIEEVVAVEEDSSANESPAIDQPVEQELVAQEPPADEDPKP